MTATTMSPGTKRKMNTPIFDFVQEYRESGTIRMHMPGHKGVPGPLGAELSDITEIAGADVLSQPCGIIAESEANAGVLFGCRTFYSTEGSSLCVRAMVFLLKKFALHLGRKPRILAARNVHRSFLDAVSLTGVDVEWIMPHVTESFVSCTVTPEELAERMDDCRARGEMPTAVYVTSPDYLGKTADIAGLAEVCHTRGCLLAVDNAHGAYLKFLAQSAHPMDLGADICCDSAHKTLPVLTGGAYLQVSALTDHFLAENARAAMSIFATTSPPYLILQSLDLCNAYLADNGNAVERAARAVDALKSSLQTAGYVLYGDERLKITLAAGAVFSDGLALGEALRERGIEAEYCDRDFVVLMFGVTAPQSDLQAVGKALLAIAAEAKPLPKTETGVTSEAEPRSGRIPAPVRVLSPAEAVLAESEYVDAAHCAGRVLTEPAVSMPPCVPVYMSGEVLGADAPQYVRGRVRVAREPVWKSQESAIWNRQ